MKIILIDVTDEIIVNTVNIESRADAQRLIYNWKQAQRIRQHEIERVIVYGGMVRILDPLEPVPVPPQFAGQCLDARGVQG